MAIQTHLYQQNLGLPISSQDYYFLGNNNNNNFINNYNVNEFTHDNLQQQQQQQLFRYQQQLLRQRQQQQQQQIYLQNMQRKNNNDDSFAFSQPTKKQKLGTATAATTATTTSTTTTESDNMSFSQSLSAEVQKQGMEIDRYVTLQSEWLKMALQEQRKQQLGAIIKKLEAKTHQLLKQKDDEIEFATKRALELQQIVQKMEVENQTWQKVATQNEAIVFSLNNTLQQLQQQQLQQQEDDCVSSSSSSNDVVDAESICNVNNGETTTTTTTKGEVVCKVCKTRNACVLLLPCRHMCCCKVCEVGVDDCPLCNSSKMATIHALIS